MIRHIDIVTMTLQILCCPTLDPAHFMPPLLGLNKYNNFFINCCFANGAQNAVNLHWTA